MGREVGRQLFLLSVLFPLPIPSLEWGLGKRGRGGEKSYLTNINLGSELWGGGNTSILVTLSLYPFWSGTPHLEASHYIVPVEDECLLWGKDLA